MTEAFTWPEGTVVIYTGNATPSTSAIQGYAQDSRLSFAWGWDNRQAAGGNYRDHLTGKRVDVSVGAVYVFDKTLARIAESATAVHMKFIHSSVNGTAGYFLYSGRIESIEYAGSEPSPYTYTFKYHANYWSGF